LRFAKDFEINMGVIKPLITKLLAVERASLMKNIFSSMFANCISEDKSRTSEYEAEALSVR
jgi:hypothetical protein